MSSTSKPSAKQRASSKSTNAANEGKTSEILQAAGTSSSVSNAVSTLSSAHPPSQEEKEDDPPPAAKALDGDSDTESTLKLEVKDSSVQEDAKTYESISSSASSTPALEEADSIAEDSSHGSINEHSSKNSEPHKITSSKNSRRHSHVHRNSVSGDSISSQSSTACHRKNASSSSSASGKICQKSKQITSLVVTSSTKCPTARVFRGVLEEIEEAIVQSEITFSQILSLSVLVIFFLNQLSCFGVHIFTAAVQFS